MGTKEQDRESPSSPMASRDVELTNDSLLNNQNGGADGQNQTAGSAPENGNGADTPRRSYPGGNKRERHARG